MNKEWFRVVLFMVSISGLSLAHAAKGPLPQPTPSSLLLKIEGHIYPRDQFPEQCKDLLKGERCNAPSFGRYQLSSQKQGDLVFSHVEFSGPEGVQVTEESWEQDGRVKKATVENRALNKRSQIEVVDGKIHYQSTDLSNGKVKTTTDKAEDNLVVPSTLLSYLRPLNGDLKAGKEVKVKVAVLDRLDAFSFIVKKIRTEKAADGGEVMVLEMAPGSILIKALIDPMFFYIRTDSGEMFAFEGKSGLRRKEGEKYKEMVVRTAYEYSVNQFRPVLRPRLNNGTPCTDEMIKMNEMKCSI